MMMSAVFAVRSHVQHFLPAGWDGKVSAGLFAVATVSPFNGPYYVL
jgi:hypothetical protein